MAREERLERGSSALRSVGPDTTYITGSSSRNDRSQQGRTSHGESLHIAGPTPVPISSDQSRSVPISPDQFRSVPISPDQFRSVPISPDQSRSVPISSDQSRSVPISSDQSPPLDPAGFPPPPELGGVMLGCTGAGIPPPGATGGGAGIPRSGESPMGGGGAGATGAEAPDPPSGPLMGGGGGATADPRPFEDFGFTGTGVVLPGFPVLSLGVF